MVSFRMSLYFTGRNTSGASHGEHEGVDQPENLSSSKLALMMPPSIIPPSIIPPSMMPPSMMPPSMMLLENVGWVMKVGWGWGGGWGRLLKVWMGRGAGRVAGLGALMALTELLRSTRLLPRLWEAAGAPPWLLSWVRELV